MPRDGSITLSDVSEPTLSVVCEPCGRHGRYSVARLMEQHGDAKLTDLLLVLATCDRRRTSLGHAARGLRTWPRIINWMGITDRKIASTFRFLCNIPPPHGHNRTR